MTPTLQVSLMDLHSGINITAMFKLVFILTLSHNQLQNRLSKGKFLIQ